MIRLLCVFCCCLPLRHLFLTSGYGYRVHPVTGMTRFHSGIDLTARQDTVFAVMPGHVTVVDYDPVTGIHIRMRSGNFAFMYGHLSQVFVLPGDSAHACMPLGITGATGRVTAEHLHFSVSFRDAPINPILFLTDLTKILTK